MHLKVLTVFLIAVSAAELVSAGMDLVRAFQKCGDEIGIDLETVEKFNATRPVHTDDTKIKCYLKCLLQEYKWITPEGKIQEGDWEGNEFNEYKEAVNACMTVMGADPCDTAYLFHKCVVDKKEGN